MDDIKRITAKRSPRPFILPKSEGDFGYDSHHQTGEEKHFQKNSSLKKRVFFRFFISLTAFGLLIFGITFLIIFKGIHLGQTMQFENTSRLSFVAELKKLTHGFFSEQEGLLRGQENGRINILLLGRAGEHYPGKNLTDTVMIMSINTETKQVALLSLPRDLYVPITGTDLFTKLNSLYQYGLSKEEGTTPLSQTIEEITGEPIHYFFTLDFDGFEKIVDALGGISLEVSRDFYDSRYPGKNYSYETFELKKGWQTLDGATALKYVRERHDDPEGDFGRAKRQQQVIQAIKNKAFSLGTVSNVITLNRLLDTLGESVKTDMSLEDMTRFIELSRTIDTKNVTTVVVDAWKKESLLRVSHVQVGSVAAFILLPRVGNWSEIRDTSATLFNRDEEKKRKQAVLDEKVSLTLFSSKADSASVNRLATFLKEELGFTHVTTLPIPGVDNPQKESIIVEQVGLRKPFSLDELLKRFSVTQATTLPFVPRERPDSDYSMVVGTDLAETFSLTEGDEALVPPDDTSFSDPLPPQPKKKRH